MSAANGYTPRPDGIGGPGGQVVLPHPSAIATRPVWGLVRDEPLTDVRGHVIKRGGRVYVTPSRHPVCEQCAVRGAGAVIYREVVHRG